MLVVGEATVRLACRTPAALYALREGLATLDDADLAP
jgi:hypothetical protein